MVKDAIDEVIIPANSSYDKDFLTKPVSMLEFACSPKYLNQGVDLFEVIKQIISLIDQPNIREIYLILGKGSGKSTLVEICALYGVYIWSCYRDPFKFFKIMHTAKPACVNVSVSKDQARDVIFEGCLKMVEASPWFKGRHKPPLKSQIDFNSGITLYAGHGNAAAWLGYATYVGGMDEVEFMVDSNNKSQAGSLYNALRGSLRTRYPKHFKLICISSAKERYSFLMKKVQRVLKTGKPIILDPDQAIKSNTNEFSDEIFKKYLNSQANIDMANLTSIMDFLSTLQIQAAESDKALAIIAPTWMVSDRESLNDFLPDFADEDQRAMALRDFACVPVFSINPFFKNPAAIFARADTKRQCPIEDDLTISDSPDIKFVPYEGADYYFAADLSIDTDSIGLSMVCKYPYAPDVFELVFSKQVRVSRDSEADYEAIEYLVKMLRDRGFNIRKAGFDKFQSHRTKQNLEKDGFEVEIVNYRDSLASNRTLKELIITGRFIFGDCDDVFMGEASELQIINSKRIDHLSSGGVFNSKDVWDAVVNSLFLCLETPDEFVTEYE